MSPTCKSPSKESSVSISTCDTSHDGCRSPSMASTTETISCYDPVHDVQFSGNVALSIRRQSLTTCGAYKPMLMSRVDGGSLRIDCRRKQRLVVEAVQQAASKLGSAHPLVENANEKIKEYRSREEKHRWGEIVSWHKGTIAAALGKARDGGSLRELEDAVALANASELGGGHAVVLEGKAELLSLRKELALQQEKATVDLHATRLHAALMSCDLDSFAKAIAEASDAIGSSHTVVETSRELFKGLRAQKQRYDWEDLVKLHEGALAKVCETSSPESIQSQLTTTMCALGLGHPLVQAAKNFLLLKRKSLQHEQEQKTFEECYESVSTATAAAEVALQRLEAESEH